MLSRSCARLGLALAVCLTLLGVNSRPVGAVQETVDIAPAHGEPDRLSIPGSAAPTKEEPKRPAEIESLEIDIPDLPKALIEPLDITPEWDIAGFDVSSFDAPSDAAGMMEYLSKGYTPPEEELSLYAALALALRYNHDLNRQRLEAAAACAGIDINWADLRPQVSLNAGSFIRGSAGGQDAGTGGGGGNSDDNDGELTSQLALNLTQRIYDWGLTSDLVERDRAQYAVRVHVVEMAEDQLVDAVTVAYYEFSLALGRLRIRDDALALAQEFLRQTRIQFDVGVVPRLDVIRAEARVEQARDELLSAQADLGDSAARFFALLGVDYTRYIPAVVTADLIAMGDPPQPLDNSIETGIGHRAELDMQFATLLAGEAAISLARNRPVLEGYANGLLQTPSSFSGNRSYELGVNLLWNVFTGGRDKAQKKQAELNVLAISEGLHDLESQIELDVTVGWNRLIAARSSVDAARRNLDLSAEALRAAAVGYRAGVTPYIEFQDALDQNIAAALGYLSSLIEVKLGESNLSRAMGWPMGYPGDLTREEYAELAGASAEPADAPKPAGAMEEMSPEADGTATSDGEPVDPPLAPPQDAIKPAVILENF